MNLKRGAALLAVLIVGGMLGGAHGANAPLPPTGFTGNALDGQVDLAWQPVAGATYNIYRGLSVSTRTTLATGITGTTYDDTTAANGTTYYYSVRAIVSGSESADSLLLQATAQARSCGSGNAIHVENCSPGSTRWKLAAADPVSSGGVEGFATASSINKGGSLDLKINGASTTTIRAEIYRLGFYGGSGGRLVSTIRGIGGIAQPACNAGPPLDCSNWATSATITTTAAWASGVYFVRLVREDVAASDATIMFVVRDDARIANLLYSVPVDTYQAYNNYGGQSLYDFNSTGSKATKVSFNRPYVQPRTASMHDWFTRADLPLVSWLEQSGYDVSYGADTDLETSPVGTHKSYVLGPHSEYWSSSMRNALTNARDAGTSIFVAGSNAIYWRVRFEDFGRTLVCSKSTTADSGLTSRWRDANLPENALLGQQYVGDNATASFPLVVSAAQGQDQIWRHTPLATLAAGTTFSIGSALVGWEWDARVANGFEPGNVITLASSPVTGGLTQTDGEQVNGSTNVNVTKYTAASGALVFDTGT
ncbi:MAG: hypothetical protein QOE91_1927, partial [Gaiellaceae bacterium]|nr:hypothetical protein [Gaiellaceae bacterium]